MDYKKQHYVPASYLQFFGDKINGRETEIYLSADSRVWFKKKVGDICGSNDFYSADFREKSEKFLSGTFEGDYPKIVTRVINGEDLSIQDAYDLLRYKIHLYCRSPACKVVDDGERIQYFMGAFRALMFEVANYESVKSEKDTALFMANTFHSTIIYFDEPLFNSDNPIIVYRSELGYYLVAGLITPHHLSIHADKRGYLYNGMCGTNKANAIMADIVRNRIRFIIHPTDFRGAAFQKDDLILDPAMADNMLLSRTRMRSKSIIYDDRFPVYKELTL